MSEVKIGRSHIRALLIRVKGAIVWALKVGLAVWVQLPDKEMKILTEKYTVWLAAQVGKESDGALLVHPGLPLPGATPQL